jgi:hypothetical protein
MLAFGQKACELSLRLRGCVRAGHADDIEALLARDAAERVLDGGGLF